ncbi:hypothetical protein CL622_04125 [archaeon]|nr:hypothetical protein [archaeon]
MSNENLKKKVLEWFSKEDQEDEKTEKFETVVLADDMEVEVQPALEAGAAIVATLEGEPQPMPIGEYILKDGRTIVIEEAGVIASISAVEEDQEQETTEDMEGENKEQAQVKKIIERIESEKIFEKLNEAEKTNKFLKEENEALKTELTDYKKVMTEQFEALKTFTQEVFTELLDEPSKEPVKKPAFNPFKKDKKENIFLTTKND